MMARSLIILLLLVNHFWVRSFPVTVKKWQPLRWQREDTTTQTMLFPTLPTRRRLFYRSFTRPVPKFMTVEGSETTRTCGENGAGSVIAEVTVGTSTETGIAELSSRTKPIQQQSQHLGSPICLYDQIIIPVKLVSTFKNASNALIINDVEEPIDDTHNEVIPQQEIIVYDITKQIQQFIKERCGMIQGGTITLCNRHTTTSLIINEYESRLLRDMQTTFLQFVPPDVRSYAYQKAQRMGTPFPNPGRYYEHNDIHLRPESWEETVRCYENGYNISDPDILQSWRDSEPINAHSHLLSMMIGSPTLTIPIHNSTLQIGMWQSIMLIDFDGPRRGRTVGIQIMGYQ